METIDLLGCEYQIIPREPGTLFLDGEKVLGHIDCNEKIIEVEDGPRREESTMHEGVHGILDQSGLSELLDERLEEAICVAVSHGLSQAGYRRVQAKDLYALEPPVDQP